MADITENQQIKYENLKQYIKELGSVAVAFSSGVDSTFLLKAAHFLKENSMRQWISAKKRE